MPAQKIRGDYELLAQIAKNFALQAANAKQVLDRIQQRVDTLQSGDWIGKGATAFYREMDGEVLPSLKRFVAAMERGEQAANQTIKILQDAEQRAAKELGAIGTAVAAGAVAGRVAAGDGAAGAGGPGDQRARGEGAQAKAKAQVIQLDRSKPGSRFSPGIGVKYGVDGSVFESGRAAGEVWGTRGSAEADAIGGEVGFGTGFSEDGFSVGPYAEGHVASAETGFVMGSENIALTGGAGAKILAGEASAGIQDGSIGASIGGTLASVEGEVGFNVAGANVGVNAEAGFKAELGFKIGKETEIKLPFVTVGLTFGGAREIELENE